MNEIVTALLCGICTQLGLRQPNSSTTVDKIAICMFLLFSHDLQDDCLLENENHSDAHVESSISESPTGSAHVHFLHKTYVLLCFCMLSCMSTSRLEKGSVNTGWCEGGKCVCVYR